MMTRKERTWATIPPYFPDMFFGGFFLYVGVRLLPQTFWELNGPELIFLGIGIFELLGSCVHCTILPKGLLIRFLWIPFRFIRWENVGNAELLDRWFHGTHHGKYQLRLGNSCVTMRRRFSYKDGPAWYTGQGIFLTTKYCPGFFPEVESMFLYRLRHPVGAMFFRMMPIRMERYLRLFLRYYPEFDIPLDLKQMLEEGK